MWVSALPKEIDAKAAALRLWRQPGLVWLDGQGGSEGRYSFVSAMPCEIRACAWGERSPYSLLNTLAVQNAQGPEDAAVGDTGLMRSQVPAWAGYIAYDAHRCERMAGHANTVGHRALWWGRYAAWLAFDRTTQRGWLIADDRAAGETLLHTLNPAEALPRAQATLHAAPPAEAHRDAIERALQHIARGDIYQVNLARRWSADLHGDALALWLAMRAQSPVPLGFYLENEDGAVLAATMERFLRWHRPSGLLTTRPIKGTIARSGDDFAHSQALRADPKERAEHAMIVDLMRNDLSRVATLGSVRVPEVMQVEPYAKLAHLVSTVQCTTRAGVTLGELIEATFPPGSVTGTPKLRAMEIIEALEPTPRGLYTGAVGFVDQTGGLSLAVAIRTAVVHHGTAAFCAGGGIVEASDPVREIAETVLKARVFTDAIASL